MKHPCIKQHDITDCGAAMIGNIARKILTLCDNNHRGIMYINILLYILGDIFMYSFYGITSADIFQTFFYVICSLTIATYKSDDENVKRVLTGLVLICAGYSTMYFFAGLYHVVVGEMSFIQAVIFSMPLIICAILVFGRIMPMFIDKAKSDVKFLIRLFFKK